MENEKCILCQMHNKEKGSERCLSCNGLVELWKKNNEAAKKQKVTRETLERHLLVYQLGMVGKTLLDTLDDDKWYFNITMTFSQREEFKKYAIKTLKKVLKCNTTKATEIYDDFNKNLGLRIKNK